MQFEMHIGQKETVPMACPYNPLHLMPRKSFLTHLNRCKETNKHLFAQCRFDREHVFLKTEIVTHEANCPRKQDFELQTHPIKEPSSINVQHYHIDAQMNINESFFSATTADNS